ncbi:unnamed protein product [Rotaria socialis]|uniref:ADP ribosyltransferase domain-containing protein n=1 Tax=Rotaria socialis TaxID=392032 RepID=A0A821KJA9_9BILA|nr:unnamed protein product [Rotaria socialis]CAF4737782.1 unnamed protein product [Rotaria socialis]
MQTKFISNFRDESPDREQGKSKRCHSVQRFAQHFNIVWLDPNIKESDETSRNSLARFRTIADATNIFNDPDQFIDYITRPRSEKLFLVVSDTFARSIFPRIHKVVQVDSIYVFDNNQPSNARWNQEWSKVKGTATQFDTLCNLLKLRSRQCEDNFASTSVVPSANVTGTSSDELDPSFMYSQILKEILLDVDYNSKAKNEFVKLCREQFSADKDELKVIDEFEQYYPYPSHSKELDQDPSPIWWYTRDCFLYVMLNKALRTLDIEKIIKMGFFIRDIHRQIEEIHLELQLREPLEVYRGQGMIADEFEKLKNNKGGLLSFNNFLSTSMDRDTAKRFAYLTQSDPSMTAILFQMSVDPSGIFAVLGKDISFYDEKEVLLSMHTVFRICAMRPIEDGIWEVELKLTLNDDEQLKILTNQIRKEIGVGTGWDRLGTLLVKMGELNKAEDIYKTLLSLTRDDDWKMLAHLNNQLGYIMKQKGDLSAAIAFYQKTLEIQQKYLAPKHIDLGITYSNIGSVHDSLGDYTTALTFYRKTLEIKLKSLSSNDISLATTYNNIGSVHDSMQDYATALHFYEKALEIQEKSLSLNHPSLATTFSNIGKVHREMEDYSTALSFYHKACEIFERSLPANHPSRAIIYNNIGLVHDFLENYSKALTYYQKTLEIKEKSLSPNHLSFATTYNNIAFVHKSMGHYGTALSFYRKALEIAQYSLPPTHQDIQDLKEQICFVQKRL